MAREKLIVDRLKFIEEKCRGKDVLDVGCAGTEGRPYPVPWNIIKKAAKSYMGVDLRKTDDPHMVQGDVETVKLNKKFDVIVAGDIIEHVTNQGLFLENMKHHLKDDGIMIITTPNIRSRWMISPVNPEHTLWHDKWTLKQMLERADLKIVDFYYYFGNKPLFFLFELYRHIVYRLFHGMAEGMLAVVKK